jgi:transposase, IS5 family
LTKGFIVFLVREHKHDCLSSNNFAGVSVRKILEEQVQLGQIDIASVEIELHTRDELPQLLRGLQCLYENKRTRRRVFDELISMVPADINLDLGRRGMDLWRILVLGCVRLVCNWDYDKLQEIANNHVTLRQMLGHGMLDFEQRYPRQTLNDNLRWFTPEVLDRINRIVVKCGRQALGVSTDEEIHCRCDSFVVETDVHFPTDINLLWDALRKALHLTHQLSKDIGLGGWRQTEYTIRSAKRLFRGVQRERDRDKKSDACLRATEKYVQESGNLLVRVWNAIAELEGERVEEIRNFVRAGEHQIKLIERRCFNGETIPHCEKVFSLFEPHTEWISKGKAGVPQELGLRVAIMESTDGFILHHRVMEQENDAEIGVDMVKDTKRHYPGLSSCSMDKGFWEPEAFKKICGALDLCVIPKKGKCTPVERQREGRPEFKLLRRTHAAVESAINALECHGLDRCPDHGIDGFRRYTSLAVVARNLQLLGSKLQEKELTRTQQNRVKVKAKAA